MTTHYYITTPIFYVNGPPHLGHAYISIATDVMARWKRLDGFDVFFLTGTDEHGQKVERAARAAGVDPQSFTDRISADFRDMSEQMGVSFDQWFRTTEERHKISCTELWRRIEANGDIYLGHYEGWYAVRDEAFYDEEELTTRPDGSKVAPSGAPVDPHFIPLAQITPGRFLSNPGLWIGLAFAAVFLAAAVRLRRYREPI